MRFSHFHELTNDMNEWRSHSDMYCRTDNKNIIKATNSRLGDHWPGNKVDQIEPADELNVDNFIKYRILKMNRFADFSAGLRAGRDIVICYSFTHIKFVSVLHRYSFY